jgi:hypothetical protein
MNGVADATRAIATLGTLIASTTANFVAVMSRFLGGFAEGEPYQNQSDPRGEK